MLSKFYCKVNFWQFLGISDIICTSIGCSTRPKDSWLVLHDCRLREMNGMELEGLKVLNISGSGCRFVESLIEKVRMGNLEVLEIDHCNNGRIKNFIGRWKEKEKKWKIRER